ncbi:cytochrome P450 [Crucibulum laeve]|uniref:Cytochrome P450 n=1 Tax=Crucibulum laeve TaxID=68775 RepID=A0A5C3LS74_9AGAR|nr:cytochrome P450 [Crucibulum laeve]
MVLGISSISGLLVAAVLAFPVYRLAKFLYDGSFGSSLRYLPGPPNKSLIYGNLKEIWKAENSILHEQWVQEYGPTIKYKGFFGLDRLYTTDTKALNHVLMNSYYYQKPEAARYNLGRILGTGVLVVEEDKHKQQRKIMNPAFGTAQIRELTEIFTEKSVELRDLWASEIAKQGGTGRIDVLAWLSKMTLDVIGLAGFNYMFDTLKTDKNELNEAFSTLFRSETRMSLIPILRSMVPALRPILEHVPEERDKEARMAGATMKRIGVQLLRDSKAAIVGNDEKVDKASSLRRRDLLSLLLRANMATDIPESQRMTDEDVLAQVPTFLVAGHETTSTGTTWALYALTQSPEVQKKLRDELLTVSTDNPTMDELNALPYLDAVVRETLRIHAPVPSTIRVAMKDDILPVNKPFTDTKGRVQTGIPIKKGQTILVPILAMNRDRSIWGDDASEFKPERWESVPEAAGSVPGVWGNMLTFLGGPRACIGYRFSLVEMKALLFTLVRAFELELAVPAKDLTKKSSVVQRPVVITEPDKNQMPLLIRPYNHL